MKKKISKKLIVIALLIAMLFPFRVLYLKDGGSVEYKALLYTFTKIHRLSLEGGFDVGWSLSILGFEVCGVMMLDN